MRSRGGNAVTGSNHRQIIKIIAEGCGLDPFTPDSSLAKRLNYYAVMAMTAADPGWRRPDHTEGQIEETLRDLRKLRKSLRALDGFTLSALRRSADGAYRAALANLEAAAKGGVESAILAAHEELAAAMAQPTSEWADLKALAQLDALEAALTEQAQRVVSIAPSGAGRRPNLAAYRLAEVAVRAHMELAGSKPTYWTGGSTPFSRMLDSLFNALGVSAQTRKPYEAAMHKLCPEG